MKKANREAEARKAVDKGNQERRNFYGPHITAQRRTYGDVRDIQFAMRPLSFGR